MGIPIGVIPMLAYSFHQPLSIYKDAALQKYNEILLPVLNFLGTSITKTVETIILNISFYVPTVMCMCAHIHIFPEHFEENWRFGPLMFRIKAREYTEYSKIWKYINGLCNTDENDKLIHKKSNEKITERRYIYVCGDSRRMNGRANWETSQQNEGAIAFHQFGNEHWP